MSGTKICVRNVDVLMIITWNVQKKHAMAVPKYVYKQKFKKITS